MNRERYPSEIGVVKTIDRYITVNEFAEIDLLSKGNCSDNFTEGDLNRYEWFLNKISTQPEFTPMAITYFERIFPKKEKELRLHKKFFSGLTREERENIFHL